MKVAARTAVIGGGAAGMAAAITAASRGPVTLLERQARLGRKLSVTGNGRCNLTNSGLTPERYHGEDPSFPEHVLSRFSVERTLAFFRSLGLVTVEEPDGRVYPFSDQAGSVVDVLRLAVSRSGVDVRTGCRVLGVRHTRGGFEVETDDGGEIFCDKVIVAAGGAAGVGAGGSELGYRLLEGLGHTCTKLCPSLVQLKTDNTFTRPLRGVRADAGVTAVGADGRVLAESAGEVQFTDYGVSGPAIFEVSRAVTTSQKAELRLDLLRPMSCGEIREYIAARRHGGLTLENLLTGALHNKVGRTVLSRCGLSLSAPALGLSDGDMDKIVRNIKDLRLAVTGNLGMEGAQVTAGGMRTGEFVPETLESRLVPGLFAAGEVLDVDGDCGGFNLQWAWSSGLVAGLLGEAER